MILKFEAIVDLYQDGPSAEQNDEIREKFLSALKDIAQTLSYKGNTVAFTITEMEEPK